MSMEYYKRIIDAELNDQLDAMGAVLIVGPKWCGKTTTAMQIAKSALKMQYPDKTWLIGLSFPIIFHIVSRFNQII